MICFDIINYYKTGCPTVKFFFKNFLNALSNVFIQSRDALLLDRHFVAAQQHNTLLYVLLCYVMCDLMFKCNILSHSLCVYLLNNQIKSL